MGGLFVDKGSFGLVVKRIVNKILRQLSQPKHHHTVPTKPFFSVTPSTSLLPPTPILHPLNHPSSPTQPSTPPNMFDDVAGRRNTLPHVLWLGHHPFSPSPLLFPYPHRGVISHHTVGRLSYVLVARVGVWWK